jgi:hypothetical protein
MSAAIEQMEGSDSGSVPAVSGRISVAEIIEAMRGATEEEMADMMAEMFRGNVLFQERSRAAGILVEDATPVKKAKAPAKAAKATSPKAAKAPKAPAKAKKEAAPMGGPEGEDAPTPESYRLSADEINADLCQARKYAAGSEDKRWAPHVYSESQCKRKPVDGTELCQLCTTCFEKESQDEKFKKWLGLITEDPESTTHMLGTEWAAKCKWVGTPAPAEAPAPAAEAPEEDSASAATEEAVAAAVTATVAPVSTPPPTTKTVPKSPPKAPVKAVPAKATPAKAPAAATPAKAPAKTPAVPAAKAPAVPTGTAAKAAAPAAKGKIAAVLPVAAAVSEPVADAGELKLIGGDFYWVANGNVYEYDQIEEAKGDFVGRLTAEETIDGDGEEETV